MKITAGILVIIDVIIIISVSLAKIVDLIYFLPFLLYSV